MTLLRGSAAAPTPEQLSKATGLCTSLPCFKCLPITHSLCSIVCSLTSNKTTTAVIVTAANTQQIIALGDKPCEIFNRNYLTFLPYHPREPVTFITLISQRCMRRSLPEVTWQVSPVLQEDTPEGNLRAHLRAEQPSECATYSIPGTSLYHKR